MTGCPRKRSEGVGVGPGDLHAGVGCRVAQPVSSAMATQPSLIGQISSWQLQWMTLDVEG
eukprot:CAMPEP_0174361880 /NCGR_PEP_ID=MMETSP0811_2-20130205/61486_1 /TAXON_ID=73025 ORGANISM="Eutreptiella gymnastica-like, Strain CCMP1594" /NCGR_SAMPLE_ID=MMETSP0811_2 /ASSEMBLY_ACC=CAM_ASM_000667 /LENGTH=59 /DNA_ID=CAMNT_0015498967 /DNA_START=87 /DNA_END=262 /DNA_ORIENTATION=-